MWSTLSPFIPMDVNYWFTYVTACCACWIWEATPSCNAILVLPTSKSTFAALSAHAVALLSRARRMVMRTCGIRKQVSGIFQFRVRYDQWRRIFNRVSLLLKKIYSQISARRLVYHSFYWVFVEAKRVAMRRWWFNSAVRFNSKNENTYRIVR